MKKSAAQPHRTTNASRGRPTGPRPRTSPRPGPSDDGEGLENRYVPGDGMSIVLTGHWLTGGMLEILVDGEIKEYFRFPPAPWSVLANLMLAAIRAQSTHWFCSYVATSTLADSLQARGVLQPASADKIHKLVNKIRTELSRSKMPKLIGGGELTGKQWAESLVRSSKGPGYRIALPAKNLRLFIGESEYKPNGE